MDNNINNNSVHIFVEENKLALHIILFVDIGFVRNKVSSGTKRAMVLTQNSRFLKTESPDKYLAQTHQIDI